ncbi:TIM barrel protein [Chromohalobacter canadensis]|uniref:TIM barrel protein n=1 Tax=Chromohalobacter canadensis TaxID=141389 RepID=A0ABZ0Y7T9_9GAMM|nr:TIM barrel protein [Chromohalobacter canadensis]MCK0769817.1 TIM barrel protein [Chromohalobacter canadensis]WQH08125.1 TIM barrel protein [Chromohalobacter canadensis]
MSQHAPRFALNHMICPRLSVRELIDGATQLGLSAIELRNDVGDNSIKTLDQAREAGRLARDQGIEILSINALYPFNIWNDEHAEQAENLAQLVDACGGRGLVLCPLVGADHNASEQEKRDGLKEALTALDRILGRYDLQGFVEPLGFPISSLRSKQAAVDTIRELELSHRFSLVHDTFHHAGAGEQALFPEHTGLVHVSGVEDQSVDFETMLDEHRLLVGPHDRLGSIAQVQQLLSAGYDRYISFEPFAPAVCNLDDPFTAIQESMDEICRKLTA